MPETTMAQRVSRAKQRIAEAGLELLAFLDSDERVSRHHRLYAMRGHLLQMAGSLDEARNAFEEAARRTASAPEKRYLLGRAQACVPPTDRRLPG